VFKDNLQEQRPSRDNTFVNRVTANLRPPVVNDWSPIAKLAFARHEADGPGNDLWLSRRQNFDEANYVRRQFVAEDAGQILGYGAIEQTIYLPRYQLLLVMDPRWLKLGVGDLLLERLLDELKKAGAITVSCKEYASQTEPLTFLQERGFTKVDELLDLRLDVPQAETSRFKKLVERVAGRDITISTLAEERNRDPHYVEKLYELTTTLQQTDPARLPFAPPAYNAREALMWLEMPYVLPEGYFIARHGENYIGLCDVSLFDAMPDGLTHGFTGVRGEYRRQGIATALKLRAIDYAKRHGFRLIQSFNRPVQSEVLALNYKLGFQLSSARLTLEKCMREVVEVDPCIYDQYAGRYCDLERRPDLEMIVRNETGRLTVECVGQKVELFPLSETQFFVKQFYGEATFQRDENGCANFLKFEMPAYKTRRRSLQYAKRIE
jgi:GNAT superfamily N-acetyltransferase